MINEDAASYSFWSKFNCKRRGYLHHILGLRPQYLSRYLLRGGAIHMALAYFYTSKGDTIGTLKCFKDNLGVSFPEYQYEDDYTEDLDWGEQVLTSYVLQYNDDFAQFDEILAIEQDFSRELTEGILIHGVLDLVVRISGMELIWDHKTSSRSVKMTYEDFEYSDQGPTYLYLRPDAHGVLVNILYKNRGNINHSRPSIVTFTPEEVETWRQSTIGIMYDISSRALDLDQGLNPFVLFPRNPELCNRCDYPTICRRYMDPTEDPPEGFVWTPTSFKKDFENIVTKASKE